MELSDKVLLVDDDANILAGYKRSLRKDVDMTTALGAAEALEIFEGKGPFAVVVSDQRMPGVDGVHLLGEIAERSPDTARIMLTGNADQTTVVEAINLGHVHQFLNKPCSPETMLAAITQGLRDYQRRAGERDLLEKTLAGSVKLLIDLLSLQNAATFAATGRLRRWATEMTRYVKGLDNWQINMAVMLAGLGRITLPAETLARIEAKEPLSAEEARMLEQSPAAARELIRNIPRLEAIAEAVYYQNKGYDGSGFPDDGKKGDDIPLGGRVLKLLGDLAKISKDDHPSGAALAKLETNIQLYDPKLLGAMVHAFAGPSAQARRLLMSRNLDVNIYQLKEGDKLLVDLASASGDLILAAGYSLTRPLIQKIHQIAQLRKLREPIKVQRIEEEA